MGCTQTNICLPNVGLIPNVPNARLRRTYSTPSMASCLRVSSVYASATNNFQHYQAFPRLIYSSSKYKRCTPVCVHNGKGNPKSENWAFSWDPLKKAMGGLGQDQSLEGLLRKQMQERELNGDGGAKNPPGGGSDGSGGSEDGDFTGFLDELLQVILATIGFIFVYIYFIIGEELTGLAKNYIKYLFGGKTSVRLSRTISKWKKFYESITWQELREDWLERAIVATPTWWHKPRRLVRWMRLRGRAKADRLMFLCCRPFDIFSRGTSAEKSCASLG